MGSTPIGPTSRVIEDRIRSAHERNEQLGPEFVWWALREVSYFDSPSSDSAKIVARSLGQLYAEELACIASIIADQLSSDAESAVYDIRSSIRKKTAGVRSPGSERGRVLVQDIRRRDADSYWGIRTHSLVHLALALAALDWALDDPGDYIGPIA